MTALKNAAKAGPSVSDVSLDGVLAHTFLGGGNYTYYNITEDQDCVWDEETMSYSCLEYHPVFGVMTLLCMMLPGIVGCFTFSKMSKIISLTCSCKYLGLTELKNR